MKIDLATGQRLVGPIPLTVVVDGMTVFGEPRAALVNGPLAAIPTLSTWILLALAVALAGIAFFRIRPL